MLCNQPPWTHRPLGWVAPDVRTRSQHQVLVRWPRASCFGTWRMYGNQRVASQDLTYEKSNIIIKSTLKPMFKKLDRNRQGKCPCLMYLGNTNCSRYHWMTAVDARSNLKTSSQHAWIFGEEWKALFMNWRLLFSWEFCLPPPKLPTSGK